MRLLLDSCVWGKALADIEAADYDVIWTGDWPEDPGDDEILARAYREGRILVTLDKDFGELAVLRGMHHCGILRLVDLSANRQAEACLHALALYGNELQLGAIVTVEPGWVRIRLRDEK